MARFSTSILLALSVLHLAGMVLFLYLGKAPVFSYGTIFLSSIAVLLTEKSLKRAAVIFAVIFLAGFLIELIGVHSGLLFGEYAYHPAMGPQFYETPILIGSTWYAVVAGTATISQSVRTARIGKAVLAGLLAALMDVLIEQVAVHYGLWYWKRGTVPFFNFVCWFIFGTVFAFIYLKWTTNTNKTAVHLFWIWLVFFAILAAAN